VKNAGNLSLEKNIKEINNSKIKNILYENMVTFIFIILCTICVILSKQPMTFVVSEIITRLGRNAFLVLSLIIPVLAGMGLNFGIVIGAMAGQIAIIAVTHWKITGIEGFLLCIALSTPFALLFGYLSGRLLNRTKGQEMIASMILGFFANGLYQLVFLFLIGTLIPMDNPVLVLNSGIGIKNTIDLSNGIKYSLDNLLKLPMFYMLIGVCLIGLAYSVFKYLRNKKNDRVDSSKYIFYSIIIIMIIGLSIYLLASNPIYGYIKLPVVTYLVIGLLCLFNVLIVKTKIGQEFRAVGQDRHIAEVSGIKVDRVRVLAIVISTVLAAWGQIIFLQNLGTLNTYGSHEQIGMFAIAAILIGGASVSKATIGQAILGTVLFHTLFFTSPMAGRELFGNAQIGEYFRVFVAYGVIGLSLGLHAWKKQLQKRLRDRL
jgi:simple sugar transport system permease protein